MWTLLWKRSQSNESAGAEDLAIGSPKGLRLRASASKDPPIDGWQAIESQIQEYLDQDYPQQKRYIFNQVN